MTCCRRQITWWYVRIMISFFAVIRNYFKGLYLTIKSWLRHTYRGLPIVLAVYTWHKLSRDCWETALQYFMYQIDTNMLMAVWERLELVKIITRTTICHRRSMICYFIHYLYLVVRWFFFKTSTTFGNENLVNAFHDVLLCHNYRVIKIKQHSIENGWTLKHWRGCQRIAHVFHRASS